ncbi:MAG TPA: hypothetical protein VF221_17505 [Chloroflexota bacterium]
MTREGQETRESVQERLRVGVEDFGHRLQDEAKGVEQRVKEGIQSAIEEGKHPERRFGRPPSRRPPSGRPPPVR